MSDTTEQAAKAFFYEHPSHVYDGAEHVWTMMADFADARNASLVAEVERLKDAVKALLPIASKHGCMGAIGFNCPDCHEIRAAEALKEKPE